MTQWLTRREGEPTEPVVAPSADRSTDRQLASRPIPPKPSATEQLRREQQTVHMSSAVNPAAATPAEDNLALSTPSLVRRSRRPPPDPAPKLQQNEMIAADTTVANPHVEQTEGSATAAAERTETSALDAPERDLRQIIAAASRSWQTESASAASQTTVIKPTTDAESFPANDADLKFVQPNIDKLRTSPETSGTDSSADGSGSVDRLAKSDRATGESQSAAGSIPRREDLLARHKAPSFASQDQNATADKAAGGTSTSTEKTAPGAATPATEWIAKRSERPVTATPDLSVTAPTKSPAHIAQAGAPEASEPPSKAAPRSGDKPATQRSIVAEMFAAQVFSPRSESGQPAAPAAKPAPTDAAAQTGSSLASLPDPHRADSSAAANTAAATTNRSEFPAESLAERPLLAGTTKAPARSASPPAGTPNAPGDRAERLASSTPSPETEGSSTAQQRDVIFARSKPPMPPPPSVSAYYYRGKMPPSFEGANAPQAAPAKRSEMPVDENDMAGGTLAPLINADAARQKPLAQSGRPAPPAGALTTAQQPAAPGTWLAAYQKLVKETPPTSAKVPAPATATKRSISSDDP